MEFEWDAGKDLVNQAKHGLSFANAQYAFSDPRRVIAFDRKHSRSGEQRFFCFGLVDGRIATVRFTVRGDSIRIIGAGYWREGKDIYEKENRIRQGSAGDR